jgi:hypothetical protein
MIKAYRHSGTVYGFVINKEVKKLQRESRFGIQTLLRLGRIKFQLEIGKSSISVTSSFRRANNFTSYSPVQKLPHTCINPLLIQLSSLQDLRKISQIG